MQFTAKRSDILREAELALGAVETKTTIPVLSNFRLEAEKGRVALQATDLELAMVTGFGAEVAAEGTATVPAKRFVEILKALPEGDVNFKSLENHWIEVKSGKSKFKLAGMAAENYPVIPKVPGDGVELAAEALGEAIRKTAFAISREESRYTLNGALLITSPGGLTMVATDGHRLAMDQKAEGGGQKAAKETRTLVPRKALGVLKALIDKRGDEKVVAFAQDDSHLFFSLAGRTLISRRLTGQFPNYEAVLPKGNHRVAMVDASVLARAVGRVGLMADDRTRAVKLLVADGKIEVATPGGMDGEAVDAVEVAYSGEAVSIGFNFQYLLDVLAVVSGPVELALKDEQSAAEIRHADGYRYVLMPMRV